MAPGGGVTQWVTMAGVGRASIVRMMVPEISSAVPPALSDSRMEERSGVNTAQSPVEGTEQPSNPLKSMTTKLWKM